MFGLTALLGAISRLTDQVNRMADLFSAGCDQVEAALPRPDRVPALPSVPDEPAPHEANGAATTRKAAKGRA